MICTISFIDAYFLNSIEHKHRLPFGIWDVKHRFLFIAEYRVHAYCQRGDECPLGLDVVDTLIDVHLEKR